MQTLFRLQPYFSALYLLFVGVSLGTIFASGALCAPTIFRAASIAHGLEITVFQSGVLMTNIFVKLNFMLNALALVILVYEMLSWRIGGAKLAPILGFVSIILIFLFTLYYTPYILEAQKIGEDGIASLAFQGMHEQSVLVFKTLMISLCLLFIVRVLQIYGGYRGR